MIIGFFLFSPETRGSVLLSRKAKVLNSWLSELEKLGVAGPALESPNGSGHCLRWKVQADEERATLMILIKISLTKPLYFLCSESVVFWFSMWVSFAWAILYLTFEALPLLFGATYGFDTQANGLVFLAVSVASVIATIAAVIQEKSISAMSSKNTAHFYPIAQFLTANREQPEGRLAFPCFQCLLLPIGLFWLSVSVSPAVPWPVPVLAVGCLTMGIFSVSLAVSNFLADTYHVYASSAIAAQSFARNLFAAFVPLATEPLFDGLGVKGAGCLLGGIGLVLSAVPWILVFWGPKIRARSRIASELASSEI